VFSSGALTTLFSRRQNDPGERAGYSLVVEWQETL
jgi:hypothetical protein